MNRKLNAADKALDAHMNAQALNKELIKGLVYALRMAQALDAQGKVTAEYTEIASRDLAREGVRT